jgi:hypothetical protein
MGFVAYPALAYQFRRIVNARMGLYNLVNKSRLSSAIVVMGSSTGSARAARACNDCSALRGVTLMNPADLTQDGIDFSQSVLYALDEPTRCCRLTQAFPGRRLYRYERKDDSGAGMLRAYKSITAGRRTRPCCNAPRILLNVTGVSDLRSQLV